jgi:hypothetical protein
MVDQAGNVNYPRLVEGHIISGAVQGIWGRAGSRSSTTRAASSFLVPSRIGGVEQPDLPVSEQEVWHILHHGGLGIR